MESPVKPIIAVIGAGECDSRILSLAETAGSALAQRNFTIICGGLGGVMEGVCRGAKSSGGLTIGILPGTDPAEANPYVDIPIATGMGIGRNIIIIRSAEAVLAINGSFGTLSEIAYAMQLGKPVVGIETWEVSENIIHAANTTDAVNEISKLVE